MIPRPRLLAIVLGLVALATLAHATACSRRSDESATRAKTDQGTPTGEPTPQTSPLPSGEPLAERVLIDDIVIEIAEPENGRAVDLESRALGRDLGRLLSSSPYFAPRAEYIEPGHQARHAEFRVSLVYRVELVESAGDLDRSSGERGDAGVLTVTLDGQLRWRETDTGPAPGMAPSSNLILERRLSAADGETWSEAMSGLVADSLAAMGHDLIAKEQMRVGGTEAIASGLTSGDAGQVIFALGLVRESRSSAFFDATLAHLSSPYDEVRDRALQALVAIGDPRAVDALARQAQFTDLAFMADVLHAVTMLGGDDAREYLEFVASGHPDEEVRAIARQGLERVHSPASR